MTKDAISKYLLGLLLFVGSILNGYAQYNPDNPAEPYQRYKITVEVDPADAGNASGAGSYLPGTKVYINTSARNSNYQFLYWTLNGEECSSERGFDYVMPNKSVHFVAHYQYSPNDPSEPSLQLRNRLYVKTEPEGCGSFNITSGIKVNVDSYQWVEVYANQGYDFKGWYQDGTKVSSNTSFNYLMQCDENVTLVAKFAYNPANPGEPTSGSNDPTRKIGDVDADGTVDVTDAVILIGHYLQDTTDKLKLPVADINKDNVIDVTDAVGIIQIYLNNQ